MSCPLEINLMLHHYACIGPYTRPSPAADEFQRVLVERGLLTEPDAEGNREVTEGGMMYVEALMAVPYPRQVWAMPKANEVEGLQAYLDSMEERVQR